MAARSRSGEAVALPPIAAAPVVPALPATTGRVLETQIISPVSPSEMSDAELVAAAVKAHEAAVSSHDNMVEAAVRAGDLLREAQRRCKARAHSWSSWLLRHWQKSKTTAERYMALSQAAEAAAPQVEQSPTARALQVNTALAPARLLAGHPSLRGALEEIGINAGGTRAKAEPEGMREPGADEDEEPDNTPTGNMKDPTPAEAAVVDRLAAQQAQSDADRAAERKHRKEEWKAKKRAEEQQAKQQDTAEARAERERLAAEDKVRRAAELADMKRAEDKPTGPDKPRPRPEETQPDGPVSVNDELRALADDAVDAARRMAAISTRLAAIKFAPSEEFDLASGRSDPRLDAMRAAMQAIGAAFHPATVVAEKWAPKLRLLGALDARIVAVELARIERDEQRARESMAAFAAKRGA